MIISLSGRKGCGKSELAKICAEKGFTMLSFADALKDLACELLGMDRVKLNELKEAEISYQADVRGVEMVSARVGIKKEVVKHLMLGKIFKRPRELLQFLGTEVIRNYSPGWHIQKLGERIHAKGNYCIDDCRFPDEKIFLEKMNAICFFLIRPNNFNISNHTSEVSVKWVDFDNVIVNNKRLNTFRKKWSQFIDVLFDPSFGRSAHRLKERFVDKITWRVWLKNALGNRSTVDIAKELGCSRDKIVWWADRLMLAAKREIYKHDERAFLDPTPFHAYAAGLLTSDGCVKTSPTGHNICISFTSCDAELANQVKQALGTNRPTNKKIRPLPFRDAYNVDCSNYFIIENLKHWNLKPAKSMREEVPDIIREDETAIKHWIVGMIDGDGSVCLTKSGQLLLVVLGSKAVVDFIAQTCPFEGNAKPHKKTKLFELKWFNYCALDVAQWLEPAVTSYGLHRKWKAVKQYASSSSREGRRTECRKILIGA